MSETVFLTREEAAAASGKSKDTIRRYEREGKLTGCVDDDHGRRVIPVAALVAAKLLDPLAAGSDVVELAGRSRAERDLVEARTEVRVLTAQLNGAEARIADLHRQLEVLSALVTRAA